MTQSTLLAAVLDSISDPILVADTGHVVRYMNRAAIDHYDQGETLLGRSLLDCHNPASRRAIVEVLAAMEHEGLEERLITDDDAHRVFMRAARDRHGRVLGYFERYEPPVSTTANREPDSPEG